MLTIPSQRNTKTVYADSKRLLKGIRKMNKDIKVKQIVIRFDNHSYDKIRDCAEIEHRGLGEFVRHAALEYIENYNKTRAIAADGRRRS